ncbi:hypothetical protein [Nocardia sp. NPDC051833]|uniref:hypothetical protein n=1 Tax=Nocardia sp. NPDC051833 TaxID=3155674 RepID=UPI003437B447
MSSFGYNHKLYYRVEDLAEIADTTPRGPRHDAAVDAYVRALNAICAQRTREDWRPHLDEDEVPLGQKRVNTDRLHAQAAA